ncbi:MAG: transposase [Thermoplasmataceae archaeon]
MCSRELCISVHGRERVWRDLDSGVYHVYLHARIPRVECPDHGRIQASLPWAERHSRFSIRFEIFALEMMNNMDIVNSAKNLGIKWFQAHGIMNRVIERGLAHKSSHPSGTGVDGKSYGKHHHFITIVYDPDNNAVDHIEFDRTHEIIDLHYAKIGKDASSNIDAVPIDILDPFIASTRSNITDAESRIVFDRFHIMKHINGAVDDVRKMESRMADSERY